MSDDVDATVARCANCGAVLHGPFCAACGQAVKPLDPPVRYFWREFAQEFFDVDSRVLRSLRRLLLSPGFLTREHVEGRRVTWVSPLKLYLLTSVAAFAVLSLSAGDGGLKIEFTGGQAFGFANDEEIAAAINEARTVWLPRVMFVLVPFFGWLVSLVRRSAGRHYPSHLVFALHVHAAAFAVRAVTTGIGLPLPATAAAALNSIVPLYLLVSLPMAFRTAYGGSWPRAIRDTAIVGFLHWLVVLAVAGAVVIGAAVAGRWMANWGG